MPQHLPNPQPVRCHLLVGSPRAAVGTFPYPGRTVSEVDAFEVKRAEIAAIRAAYRVKLNRISSSSGRTEDGAGVVQTPFSPSANPVSNSVHEDASA